MSNPLKQSHVRELAANYEQSHLFSSPTSQPNVASNASSASNDDTDEHSHEHSRNYSDVRREPNVVRRTSSKAAGNGYTAGSNPQQNDHSGSETNSQPGVTFDCTSNPPPAPLYTNISFRPEQPHPNAVQGTGLAALEEKMIRLINMVDKQSNEIISLRKQNKILLSRTEILKTEEENHTSSQEGGKKNPKYLVRQKTKEEIKEEIVKKKKEEEKKKIDYDQAYLAVSNNTDKTYIAKMHKISNQVNQKVVNMNLKKAIADLLPSDFKMRKGFSTMLVSQRYVSSIDELYDDALRVKDTFEELMEQITRECADKEKEGGCPEAQTCKLSIGPLKSKKRSEMKALFKYSDKQDGGIAWYRLTDIIRATIAFEDMEKMYAGLNKVVDVLGVNNIREFNDRYVQPMAGNYRDLQLLVAVDDHVCELQLNTKKMLQAKETTGHRDFEVVRELIAAIAEGDQGRVLSALEFGKAHLADKAKGLAELLSKPELTVMHEAAGLGHADIVSSLLRHGASLNAKHPENGKTPLHCAVSNGNERCVWALLSPPKWITVSEAESQGGSSVGDGSAPRKPSVQNRQHRVHSRRNSKLDLQICDLSVKDNEGRTALVEGYIMLWTKPSEGARRAVTTLACHTGQQLPKYADGSTEGSRMVNEAKIEADKEIRKMWKQSTSLAQFASDGDVKKVRDELKEFASPNSVLHTSENGAVPAICVAAKHGHKDVIELLLEFKADLLKKGGKGFSVIDHAVFGKQTQIACYLVDIIKERELKLKIDPGLEEHKQKKQEQKQKQAFWKEHVHSTVKDWCDAGVEEEFELTYKKANNGTAPREHRNDLLKRVGFTPKDFAAGNLDIKKAEFDCADCKSDGVTVNECLGGGYSPAEIREGKYTPKEFALAGDPVVKLKEAGFTIEECIQHGIKLSMCQAAGWSDADLLKGGYSNEDFKKGEEADAELLKLEGGECADSEKYDKDKLSTALSWRGKHMSNEKCTRLHVAAYQGKVQEAKWLIQKGALVEALNEFNRTPIHWAARQGQFEIVKMLMDAGCKVDMKSQYDYTPMITAAWQGHPKVTELLIKGTETDKADMTATSTPDGYTALHWCLHENKVRDGVNIHMACAKLCIAGEGRKGSPLEVQCTVEGNTPLHFAAQKGHEDFVEFILNHEEFKKRKDTLLLAKNKEGRTPFEEANNYGQAPCATMIENAGGKE
ncbi:hypothetical protein TrLO_g7180 [Triparma laevis f. longispina]|uniref:Uncharacterized protein n=1 Tax=Triparma laevis f. longispina TaxID=1714387 RepID=A0A9W7FME3_9STRA|nr:hypothetical protein TrLO_g7180 [Triparma laevis f. longispina]